MKVGLKAIGDLRDYLGRGIQEVELPQAAQLGDLLAAIESRWGQGLPAYLWNSQTHRFKGPVVLVIDKKVVTDKSTPLHEGQEIIVMKAIAGGNGVDFQENKYGQ